MQTYTIEYSLGDIIAKDSIRVKCVDDFVDYIIRTKKGREKLTNTTLTLNIINIKKQTNKGNEDE